MKKIIIIFLLTIGTGSIFAQGVISFGPKVGWNTDRLTTDYTQYIKDFRSGFQGGVFLSLYIHKFYIQPEAYFSVKRGALETSFGDPFNPQSTLNLSQTVNLQTIDVPLLVGFKVLDFKLIRFRIFGGPVASFLMNKEYTLSLNGANHADRIERDDFRTKTWSGQIGAGIDVLMLTFDVGYEFGVDSFMTIHSLDDFNLRNNLFYCSLGWRLF